MTRIVFCGGRVGVRFDLIDKMMTHIHGLFPDMEVIEGDADGYDRAIGAWARRKGVTASKFPINADVDGDDILAPKRRNQRMLNMGKPDVCIGMPGHGGTLHMLTISHKAGVRCFDVEIEGDEFYVHEWASKRKRA